MELFKGSDPLPGNWSYDSAIDLFTLNPSDMDPVSFEFSDNLVNSDTKDLFMDPFGTPTAINGFTMPAAEDTLSLSSVCQYFPQLSHDILTKNSRNQRATISPGPPGWANPST
jgi:hypothetical protein